MYVRFRGTTKRIGGPARLGLRLSQLVAIALHRRLGLIQIAELNVENSRPTRRVVPAFNRCIALDLGEDPQGVLGLARPAIELSLEQTSAIQQSRHLLRLGQSYGDVEIGDPFADAAEPTTHFRPVDVKSGLRALI